MTTKLNLERLYYPDRKRLGSIVAGLSGAGKTTAIISTLQQAVKSKAFGEYHRFIIIDPKIQVDDYDMLADPHTDLDKALKSIREERVTLYWPDVESLEGDVSIVIDEVFRMSDEEPKSTYTFILDEASILITPSRIPPALKRLAVQGRAKRIIPIWISQRPIVNRWTDCNVSNMLLFRVLPVDADVLNKRWGVDFSEADATLQEIPYSYIWFDLESASIQKMMPVDLPKRRKKRKRRIWDRIPRFI